HVADATCRAGRMPGLRRVEILDLDVEVGAALPKRRDRPGIAGDRTRLDANRTVRGKASVGWESAERHRCWSAEGCMTILRAADRRWQGVHYKSGSLTDLRNLWSLDFCIRRDAFPRGDSVRRIGTPRNANDFSHPQSKSRPGRRDSKSARSVFSV